MNDKEGESYETMAEDVAVATPAVSTSVWLAIVPLAVTHSMLEVDDHTLLSHAVDPILLDKLATLGAHKDANNWTLVFPNIG